MSLGPAFSNSAKRGQPGRGFTTQAAICNAPKGSAADAVSLLRRSPWPVDFNTISEKGAIMDSFVDLLKQIDWKEVVATISAIAFLLTAVALVGAVLRVKQILEALREFRKSKNDLGELLDAIDRLESMTPKLKVAASDLEEEISELKRPQLVEVETPMKGMGGQETESVIATDGLSKWQEIRTIWREVRDKMEAIIAGLDGRRRRPYNQLTRNSYAGVIAELLDDRELTQVQAKAADQMNQRFLQLKPSNKTDISRRTLKRSKTGKELLISQLQKPHERIPAELGFGHGVGHFRDR